MTNLIYIEDLAAHEVHGPFPHERSAHLYAELKGLGAYALVDMRAAILAHALKKFMVARDAEGWNEGLLDWIRAKPPVRPINVPIK